MNKKKNEVKAPSYPIILSNKKGKLFLSKDLMKQINTLHQHVGAKEWSGPVLYSIINGDINNPEGLEIEAHGMYPMDIGTPGYTEYDFNTDATMDMHDYYPEIIEKGWRTGHMHTHHSMKAYFSGTDDQELRDNTPNHAYYLSLIVNFEKKYVARLCVMGKREIIGNSTSYYKNIEGKEVASNSSTQKEEDIVYAVDLDVTFEEPEVDLFMAEILKMEERQRAERAKRVKNVPKSSWWGGHNNHLNAVMPSQTSLWEKSYDQINDTFDVPGVNEEIENAKQFLIKVITGQVTSLRDYTTTYQVAAVEWNTADEMSKQTFYNSIDEVFNDAYQYAFNDPNFLAFGDNMEAVSDILWEEKGDFADDLRTYLEVFTINEAVV
jgi:hypothetical protein